MLAPVVGENTALRGTGIENGSEWSNGTVHFDRTSPTEKSGPPQDVGQTVSFSFKPKFPEILVEWKASQDSDCIDLNIFLINKNFF